MKYFGKVGYSLTEEIRPGVSMPKIVEQEYYGDMLNLMNSRKGSEVNENLELNCEVSIVADPFAFENFQYIAYVTINNCKWKVKSVRPQYPRLILSVGGVYNEQ